MIPFGEWLPDRPARDNPGATEARNVVPIAGGYGPTRSLVTYTNALTARCRGAASGIASDLGVQTFAGDETKLYQLTDSTWADVSKMGGYTTGADERWAFAEFGRDDRQLIATNFSDDVQTWTLGSSSVFADLSATCPKARHLGVVRDFLVLGNVNDSTDGAVPSRVAWGPIGNPAGVWTPSVSTQAGEQDLATGGEIQAVVGGEYGSIICRSAIHRMTYIGGELIFQFDEVVRNRGCVAPGSVATQGGLTIFLAEDGFVAFDGASLTNIGANKVDQWFIDNVNSGEYGRLSAAIDPERKLYYCAFPNIAASPAIIIVFNWELGRWSYIEQECDLLARVLSPGFTLEGLVNISSTLEGLPASLDSRQWQGGALTLGAFATDYKLGSFGGDTKAAVLDTPEVQLSDPRRTFVNGVRPIVDGTATVSLGTRERPTDAVTWTSAVDPNSRTGVAPFRSDARYHRARVKTSGDFRFAQGVDIGASPSGMT